LVLLDSNIVIYALQPDHEQLLLWLSTQTLAVSVVTRVEVLGFHGITETERRSAAALLSIPKQFSVDDGVVDAAMQLRRQRRISLADSLIAGTAFSRGLLLATRNMADFAWIRGLVTVNPFDEL